MTTDDRELSGVATRGDVNRAAENLIGARVVATEFHANGLLWLELEHKGTDDDACQVSIRSITFDDEKRDD